MFVTWVHGVDALVPERPDVFLGCDGAEGGELLDDLGVGSEVKLRFGHFAKAGGRFGDIESRHFICFLPIIVLGR